MAAADVLNK